MDKPSRWVTFLNCIFNTTFGFVHIWPKIELKLPHIFLSAVDWQLELSCYLFTPHHSYRSGWRVCVVCVLHSSLCSRGLKTSSLFSWSSRLSCQGSRRRLTRRCWKPRDCSVCSAAEIQNSPSFSRPDCSWNKSWSNYSNRRRRETRILTWVTQTRAETGNIFNTL